MLADTRCLSYLGNASGKFFRPSRQAIKDVLKSQVFKFCQHTEPELSHLRFWPAAVVAVADKILAGLVVGSL
jgi:hypothetical protein